MIYFKKDSFGGFARGVMDILSAVPSISRVITVINSRCGSSRLIGDRGIGCGCELSTRRVTSVFRCSSVTFISTDAVYLRTLTYNVPITTKCCISGRVRFCGRLLALSLVFPLKSLSCFG